MSLITLGVADLQRATAFYENVVGWKAEASPPGVTFFDLSGFILAL
jgi:predicted enzyme related to lactoylglutathione lyase